MAFAIICFLLAPIAGCSTGKAVTKIEFSKNGLDRAIEERLRAAKLYRGFDTILIIDAIRKDMGLVEAWGNEYGKTNLLGKQEVDALVEKQRMLLADKTEFVLALYTAKRIWNDLDEENSRWTVALMTREGPVRAKWIKEIDEDELLIRNNLPFDPRFRQFYVVGFPKDVAGAGPYRLSLSGLLGSVELTWAD